jgi:hypothetical protein
MPAKLPPSFGDVYAAVAQDLKAELGDATAAKAGVPLDVPVVPATEQDRVDAWSTPHPDATDEAMWQLAQQKFLEHSQAGMDPKTAERATAEDLTHFRYRARQSVYSLGTTSSAEQVREAERLQRAAQRHAAAQSSEVTPSDVSMSSD